jgi:signal transduction histidine kinase
MEKEMLVVTIKDNGGGFSMVDSSEASGFGLAGMQERATLAGGTLEIDSGPDRGTTISCFVHFQEEKL